MLPAFVPKFLSFLRNLFTVQIRLLGFDFSAHSLMGQEQSKSELLYQQASHGHSEGIKSLHRQGASLEWIDKDGKTPLILACMNPELLNVAKTLIELGANINAYRPGRHAGTPLHHAAKRGLESTVKLLLSYRANPLLMNDDCQTPLEVARSKGHTNVVRAIESNICLFSGWLREFYGPGFLELLAPRLLSRKVWVVVLPCGSRNLSQPYKLELAIYSTLQDPKPRTVIALWKANLEEQNLNHADPSVVIVESSSIPRGRRRRRNVHMSRELRCKLHKHSQTSIKLAPEKENDKRQLKWFADACKGIAQAVPPPFLQNNQASLPPSASATAEDEQLAMAINASIQSATQELPSLVNAHPGPAASSFNSWLEPGSSSNTANGWLETGRSGATVGHARVNTSGASTGDFSSDGGRSKHMHVHNNNIAAIITDSANTVPSAPPVPDEVVEGPIHYPSIDLSAIDVACTSVEKLPKESEQKVAGSFSSCVICLDAPTEGACIPCGHVAGCMSCLKEVKAKNWGCPVCRAKIDQVLKLYHV